MSDHTLWADSVGAYVLGALERDECDGFEAHLAECEICRRDVAELRVAADALPVSVPIVSPPPALKGRIMAVVESEAELLAAAGRRADEPAPARRRRGRLLAGRLAVAPGRRARVRARAARRRRPRGGAAERRRGCPHRRRRRRRRRAPRCGSRSTTTARSCSCRDMPAPPAGRIYQVWLKRPGKDPEPTSVLWSTRGDGSAEVAVPGSLEGVEAVLVTDEPPGGSETPSKAPVITAAIA